jgi:hypothetical protein
MALSVLHNCSNEMHIHPLAAIRNYLDLKKRPSVLGALPFLVTAAGLLKQICNGAGNTGERSQQK